MSLNNANKKLEHTVGSEHKVQAWTGETAATLFHKGLSEGIFRPKLSEHESMNAVLSGFSVGAPQISDKAGAGERLNFLSQPENRQSAEVKSIWGNDTRVLQIGDYHQVASVRDWTAQSMKKFAEQGATAFGMEFLPQKDQGLLDRYADMRRNTGGVGPDVAAARETLYQHMANFQRSPKQGADPANLDKEQALRKQFDLVDRAIDAGLKPLGIEPEFDSRQDYNSKLQKARNDNWSKVVSTYLSTNSENKVVMFAGASHFGHGKSDTPLGNFASTTDQLAQKGYNSTIVQMAGGDFKRGAVTDREVRDQLRSYYKRHPEYHVNTHAKILPELPDAAQDPATK